MSKNQQTSVIPAKSYVHKQAIYKFIRQQIASRVIEFSHNSSHIIFYGFNNRVIKQNGITAKTKPGDFHKKTTQISFES